ncbi:hypothetical protein R6Q57_023195 [Mikania cordata]
MQPTNSSFSDLRANHNHNQTCQYYSQFSTQNSNPYFLHQHHRLQIKSHVDGAAVDLDPPGVDPISDGLFKLYS